MMNTDDDNFQSEIESLKSTVFTAQSEVKSNPQDYDSHVKLITSLSKLYFIYKSEELKANDDEKINKEQSLIAFNKLRNARNSMSAVFPLSVELWTQWIEDELNPPTGTINDSFIEEIFNKAICDYLSVDIWCLYVNYLINRLDNISNSVSVSFIQNILEKAVINCGLHYKDGNKIWELYQKFEEKFLLQADVKLKENPSPENIENYKTHLLNLIKLFKRQMHVPLAKHEDLFCRFTSIIEPYLETLKLFTSEFQLFAVEDVKKIHDDTLEKLESITVQEKYLEECHNSLEAYQFYINHELDSGLSDPARVQCLFERTIVHHCLQPCIWLDYVDFLNDVLKQSDLALSTIKRALRNITWDFQIYVKYAILFEQISDDKNEVRNIYEMGLEKYSSNGFNYCNICISYISFEKRICDSNLAVIKKRMRIYELIQNALQQFEGLAEPDRFIVEFMIFWINIEKYWFDDEEKCEKILKYFGIKYRKFASIWNQIVTFAKMFGYKNLVYDLFNIGLKELPDSFEQFNYSLLNYENIFGTLKSRNHLEKKINIHVPYRILPRKNKEYASIKSKTEHQNKYVIGWLNYAEKQLFSIEEVRKPLHQSSKESSIPKSSNGPANSKTSFNPTIEFVRESSTERNVKKSDVTKRKHEDVSENNAPVIGPALPAGFLPQNSDDKELSDDNNSDKCDDDLMPPPKKVRFNQKSVESKKDHKPESNEHERTVYVSNLHPATSESDLKIIFGRAGNIEKVDLHRQRGGKIFAFVTYSKPEEAHTAFQLEHTPIRNRPVYVSKFNRSRDKHSIAPHYSQHQEKNKLFVSNLDRSITPNDLEKFFNRHGDMASLRLINKKGSSKAFAYVEYKTEEIAARYRDELNNIVVKGRQIIVEFSDPGRTNQTDRQRRPQFGGSGPYSHKTEETSLQETEKMEIDVNTEDKSISSPKPNKTSDSTAVNKSIKKPVANIFGFVPLQARNLRNQQPPPRKPKGPTVRLNVAPVSTIVSNENSSTVSEQSTSDNGSNTTPLPSKSNDDFRKMLLNNE